MCSHGVSVQEKTSKVAEEAKRCPVDCKCTNHWRLGSTQIMEATIYKYLGVEFNQQVNFAEYKSRIADKARKISGLAWNMGIKRARLSVKASISLWEDLTSSMGRRCGGWRSGKKQK